MRTTIAALTMFVLASSAHADEPSRGGVSLGVDLGERSVYDHSQGTSTLLSVNGEIYGPRGSAIENLGLVVDVTATLSSADQSGNIVVIHGGTFGTPSWTGGGAALRGRVHDGRAEAGLSLGLGSMEYSVQERDILQIVALEPETYRYARVAVDGRVGWYRAVLFGAVGARAVIGGNNRADAGFDAEAGVGVRVIGPLELRASGMIEEFRALSEPMPMLPAYQDRAWRARLALAADWL